jgi:hypothetical protein
MQRPGKWICISVVHHTRFVTSLQWTILMRSIHRTSVNAGFCSRLCLTLFYHPETAVTWPVVGLTTSKLSRLCFVCMASPCPVARAFGFRWFWMTYPCFLHNFVMYVRNFDSHVHHTVLSTPYITVTRNAYKTPFQSNDFDCCISVASETCLSSRYHATFNVIMSHCSLLKAARVE